MEDRASRLVYLVYGDARAFQLELTYSVLSAIRQGGGDRDFKIVLVTDQQGRRDDLPVEHYFFSPAEFEQWTYDGRYKHAAKINALAAVIDRFGGNVAMIDTDTYFLANPGELFDRIGPDSPVMHTLEGTLTGQGGYWDQIIQRSASDPEVQPPITLQSPMYNSGVIGLHSSARGLLGDVLDLMKKLHAMDPKVHNVEQFALAQVLEKKYKIRVSDDLIRHYFGYARPFIHARLDAMFPTFSELNFACAPSVDPSIEQYPAKLAIDRVRARLKQIQRSQTRLYGFAYLAYLSAFHTKNEAHANAWGTIAIDVIRWNDFPREIVAADFHRMRQQAVNMPLWMAPEIRARWIDYWSVDPNYSEGIAKMFS